jgi:hypothetical protein
MMFARAGRRCALTMMDRFVGRWRADRAPALRASSVSQRPKIFAAPPVS